MFFKLIFSLLSTNVPMCLLALNTTQKQTHCPQCSKLHCLTLSLPVFPFYCFFCHLFFTYCSLLTWCPHINLILQHVRCYCIRACPAPFHHGVCVLLSAHITCPPVLHLLISCEGRKHSGGAQRTNQHWLHSSVFCR